MRRARYQRGQLRLSRRKDGSKVWEYRWREAQTDGTRKRRSKIVGSFEDYPNESLAQTALDGLRLNANQLTLQGANKDISVEALVYHYREHELPDIFFKEDPERISDEDERKSWSTQDTYDGYLSKWFASGRVVGTQMGGCGFQEKCHLHPALDCEAENWAAKNRSFAKANSDELGIGESIAALEDENDLQPSQRLGVCQPCQERYAAVLAKVYLSRLHQASSGQNWLTEAYRLAHLPSYVWDDPECQWREPQSHSGAHASCQSQGHDGHLRPSCDR